MAGDLESIKRIDSDQPRKEEGNDYKTSFEECGEDQELRAICRQVFVSILDGGRTVVEVSAAGNSSQPLCRVSLACRVKLVPCEID